MLSDSVQLLPPLDRVASELAIGQENDSFFTQLVLERTSTQTTSIQEHIHFHEVNKFQIMRFEEQIDNHIDVSTHSIKTPFESILSCHFNQFEEFEYEKQVKKLCVCMKHTDLMITLCVWTKCLEVIWLHIHLCGAS